MFARQVEGESGKKGFDLKSGRLRLVVLWETTPDLGTAGAETHVLSIPRWSPSVHSSKDLP